MADFKDVIIRLQENKNDNREAIETQTGDLSSTIIETAKTQNRSFGQSLGLQFKRNNDSLSGIKETFTNNFQEMINSAEDQANMAADKQQAIADEAERSALLKKDSSADAIEEAAEKSDKKTKSMFGGLMGGLGKMVGGAALGGGALLAGAGILMGGGGYFLKQLNELDGKAIRENVKELMGISDDFGSKGEFFAEAGTFVVSMTAIGAGLAAFSIGTGVAAAVEYFAGDSGFAATIRSNVNELLSINDDHGGDLSFLVSGGAFGLAMTGIGLGLAAFSAGEAVSAGVDYFSKSSDFATNIRANVKELLSINDDHGGSMDFLSKGGTFFVAMTAIGAGLAVFGAGSAVAGLADGLTTFSKADWATNIVDNVTTLLGINDLFSGFGDALVEGGTFFVAMTAIAAGLAVFGAGSAVAALTSAGGDFVNPDWAQGIVDNVTTLLSIASLENLVDTALFVTTMTGIGAGLLAFSVGKGAASTAEIVTQFSGVDFAKTIKDNVTDLLGIMDDPNINVSKAADFTTVMGVISAGLLAFSGSKFVSALANVGTSILNFLSGEESPVQEMLALADNADELTTASTALDSLAVSLQSISGLQFDGSKLNMRKFAEDLSESVPLIEAAIMGGSVDLSWLPTGETRYNGLASPEIDFESATHRIRELRTALGYAVAEKQEMSAEAAASAANMSNINATNTSVQNTNVSSKSTYSVASSVHNHEKTVGMMNNINGSRYSVTDGEDF